VVIDSFDGQRENEEIVAAWRQHPWVMARAAFLAIIIILIGSLPWALFSVSWGWQVTLFFAAIAGLYLLANLYLWLNTIYFLTSERIFAIRQKQLLVRTNNEVPLVNIQNVSHTKKGLWQMLFDYGTVEVETSGAKTALRMPNVTCPYQAQQKILSSEKRPGKADG